MRVRVRVRTSVRAHEMAARAHTSCRHGPSEVTSKHPLRPRARLPATSPHHPPRPTRCPAPGPPDTGGAGCQLEGLEGPQDPTDRQCRSAPRPKRHPAPRTLPATLARVAPLLRARPPELSSAVTAVWPVSRSPPTGRAGNAGFTARGLRLSPGGTGPGGKSCLPAGEPAREGARPGPVSPPASPPMRGRE